MSGQIRQHELDDAIRAGSVARVATFFRSFVAEQHHAAPAAQRARNAQRAASSNKPVYTHEQIRDLYAAHRKGAYRGREDVWARQEADIFVAQREGRVAGVYLTNWP